LPKKCNVIYCVRGVLSPLLANLYLIEAFDQWLVTTQPRIVFERYADDIVIHTRSLEQSHFILDKLKERLKGYSLEIWIYWVSLFGRAV